MKRYLLIFIIVLLISSFGVTAIECTDSDGGKNYYKKGTTIGTYTADDVCITGDTVPNKLAEHFCDSATGHTFEIYICPKGCNDGACTMPQCGDGYCDSMTCSATGCPAAESAQNCPQDCVYKANCYNDGDCPSSAGNTYCDGNLACYKIQHYKCDKPGSREAKCIPGGTDGNCDNCQNGCLNGACNPSISSGGGSSSGGGGGGSSSSSGSEGRGGGQGGGCYDTDGGKDLFKKGISAGVWDSCLSKYKILERYCTEYNAGADSINECPLGYICNDGSCVESDLDDRKESKEKIPVAYFKSCSYIWDSAPYTGQKVKITASIKDSRENADSDAVQVEIVESNI